MSHPRRTPLLTTLAALAALFDTAASAQALKIAVAGPMTGPLAQYGDMVKTGATTAVEDINARGGVLGRQVELVTLDDACEPKQAVNVANKIASQKIRYVIGHVCSGSTIPASDIYENEAILMISPSATAPQLTEGRKRQFIFRTIGRDDQQGPAAAQHIIGRVKPKKVAVLHDKQSYGQGVASAVKAALDAAKVPVVLFEGLQAGEADYSAIVTKLKAQGVDFVYFGGYHPEMGLLLRQSREQGVRATFMGPEGVGNKDLSGIAGAAAEGMLVTLPADFAAEPANAALVKSFTAKKRDYSGPFVLTSYAAVQLVADAMVRARSADPAKVAAQLRSGTFQTPIGPVQYDAQGDLKSFKFIVYAWHQDGSKTAAK